VWSAGQEDDSQVSAKARPTVGFSINDPVRVLVVGNDEEYEQVLRTVMGRLRLSNNLETAFLHTLADARRALGNAHVDVILSDLELPDGTSTELLEAVKEQAPESRGVILARQSADEPPSSPGVLAHEVWRKEQSPVELRRKMERIIMMQTLSRPYRRTREL
jgi:DNA-binding NtrC family response regulator